MSKPLLHASGLHKSFHDGQRELKVLTGADLSVLPGQTVAVVGRSGSGKSTLMHLLGGLDAPDKGELHFRGEPLPTRGRQLNEYRNRHVGFVFQFHHLMPEFTALENVMMPMLMAGMSKSAAADAAHAALDGLGLAERATHRPSKLSGGEQQRIALARALANQPALLLADEPTGNLDVHTGQEVIRLMWQHTVEAERALVIVTHEPLIAKRADRILLLSEGRLVPVSHDEYARQLARPEAAPHP